jgi:hydroxymethylpyrimidine/phosphomethylpyrimidine kinase
MAHTPNIPEGFIITDKHLNICTCNNMNDLRSHLNVYGIDDVLTIKKFTADPRRNEIVYSKF